MSPQILTPDLRRGAEAAVGWNNISSSIIPDLGRKSFTSVEKSAQLSGLKSGKEKI